MKELIILARKDSPRLNYVAHWMSEAWNVPVKVVTEATDSKPIQIAYGSPFPGALLIPDSGLLFEKGIQQIGITKTEWNGIPCIFPGSGDVPFDIFSAIFFLLSRYEEYWPYPPDQHDRYPATQSILYQNGWLQRPLVDEWLGKLRVQLTDKIEIAKPAFSFQPSYDVDRAWQWLHRDAMESSLIQLKNLAGGNLKKLKAIRKVLRGEAADPFEFLPFLKELHQQDSTRPLFFVLAAKKSSKFDRNIAPQQPAMKQLLHELDETGIIGIHPSYYSGNKPGLLLGEKKAIEDICSHPVRISRQHFMRLKIPGTYRQLINAGFTDDYSMGYGSHLGFRAGTGRSFLFYDLEEERETTLRIHPFPFMDSTALFHEKLGAADAFEALNKMKIILELNCSRLITIFHNYTLGHVPDWKEWKPAYKNWILKKEK